MEPEAVYRLVIRLASALQAVHDRDVIHRDLSPDNIILQNDDVGQAKIIDFGISRASTAGPTIIGDGFAGKVNYMSPEQVGIFDGKVTARSDIYALGLVIAEALTGRQIDMGGTQAQIVEKRRQLPPLEGIDPRFRPLLEAMLQPDPDCRPQTMAEISEWTLGAPLGRQNQERTVILPAGPSPEQAALDQPVATVGWGRRLALGVSLLGFAGLGAAGVYFMAGRTVPELEQKPVLVAPPRENVPEVPVRDRPAGPVDAANNLPDASSAPEKSATGLTGEQLKQQLLPDNQTSGLLEQEPLAPKDRIRKFVGGYKGSDCMYLQPISVADTAAEIEGFASRTPPFISFDSEFTQTQGFEARIQVNLVSDAQCPAIAFLSATPRGSEKTQLKLDMQRTVVPSGSNMAGRISGYDTTSGSLALVFVDKMGEVSDLSPYLKSDDGGAGFVIPLSLDGPTEETGLIIAMVGPDLRTVLANRQETQADVFFDKLMQAAPILRASATTVKIVP